MVLSEIGCDLCVTLNNWLGFGCIIQPKFITQCLYCYIKVISCKVLFLFKFVSLKFNYQLLQKGRNCQKILHSYNAGLCVIANCLVFIIIHILINCGFWFFNLNVHKSHHLHACLIYYLRPCCIVAVSIVVHRYYIIPIEVPYSGKV